MIDKAIQKRHIHRERRKREMYRMLMFMLNIAPNQSPLHRGIRLKAVKI